MENSPVVFGLFPVVSCNSWSTFNVLPALTWRSFVVFFSPTPFQPLKPRVSSKVRQRGYRRKSACKYCLRVILRWQRIPRVLVCNVQNWRGCLRFLLKKQCAPAPPPLLGLCVFSLACEAGFNRPEVCNYSTLPVEPVVDD